LEGIIFGLGLSLHVGFDDNYNAVHPYVEYQLGTLRAGAYYNSVETKLNGRLNADTVILRVAK
jgi:hypothetical protein